MTQRHFNAHQSSSESSTRSMRARTFEDDREGSERRALVDPESTGAFDATSERVVVGDMSSSRRSSSNLKKSKRRDERSTFATTAAWIALACGAIIVVALSRGVAGRRSAFGGENGFVESASRSAAKKVLDAASGARPDGRPRVFGYKVANAFEHDTDAFTQGLVMCGAGVVCESTGAVNGKKSAVRVVDVQTGKATHAVESKVPGLFAEGLTRIGKSLYMISWRSNRGIAYEFDESTGKIHEAGTFKTPLSDGWGLAANAAGDELYVTDASDKLHVLSVPSGDDSETLELKRSLTITDDGKPVRFANELETIDGEVYANVLERPCIARIDPESGQVNAWINLDGLKNRDANGGTGDVLNGIAVDEDNGKLYVTGKQWRAMFEIKLKEIEGDAYEDALKKARKTCTPPFALPQYGYP